MTRYELVDIINSRDYKIGAELGVCQGQFSYYLLKHSNLDKLYSIDAWEDKIPHNYNISVSHLKHFGDRSIIIKGRTNDVCDQFDDDSLDFLYIDAGHDYQSVRDDLVNWIPKVRSGGMVSGHDYMKFGRLRVVEAVNDVMQERSEKLHVTDELLNSFWFIKA